MTVKIEIQCDTINEFTMHLAFIINQVRQKEKKLNLNSESEFPPMEFHHDNCYGSHHVEVLTD